MITHLGPILRTNFPPPIIVIGPTVFAIEKTIAKELVVIVECVTEDKYSAIGEAKTLQAYKAPMHKLIKQLAIKTIHLFFVRFIFYIIPFFHRNRQKTIPIHSF